ncbi:MAG: hypothetical protein WB579_14600 [Bryobacteraceae bacterium]
MIVQQKQHPKAVLSHTDTPEQFLIECSCNCRVFHIFRAPVARKVKTKTAHRLRLMARCVDCEKEIRLSLGGFNP